MGFENILGTTKISASGLSAERMRMEVIANNIANANTTKDVNGNTFRRRQVVFAAELNQHDPAGIASGVRVAGIREDPSELPRVHQPGHPDADEDGYVTMPNISLSNEMVDLITATRGYEANLKVLNAYKDSVRQTLSLLRTQ